MAGPETVGPEADPLLFRPAPVLAVGLLGEPDVQPGPDFAERARTVFDALHEGCGRIAAAEGDLFSPGPVRLRVVTRVGSAAERLFADGARRAGAEIALVAATGPHGSDGPVALGLPGGPDDPGFAARSGEALLGLCDLLVAVWDGRPDARPGRTGALVQEAVERRIPVLVLAPDGSGEAELIDDPVAHLLPPVAAFLPRLTWRDALPRLLARAFAPPAGGGEREALRALLAEDRAPRTARPEYRALLLLAARGPRDEPAGPVLGPAEEWDRAAALAELVSADGRALTRRRAARHASVEAVAAFHGERVRSGTVLRYIGPAFGSLMIALLAIVAPAVALAWLGVQAVVMTLTIAEATVATRGRWGERWLDMRSLGERLRVERFLAPLAIGPGRLERETETEDPAWMRWWHRRVSRETFPAGEITDAVVRVAARHLADVEIAGQVAYHAGAALRYRSLDRRLRAIATGSVLGIVASTAVLFGLTLLWEEPPALRALLMVLLITLPSVFLAARGLRLEGAFQVAAARSEQALASLTALRDRMDALPVDYDRLVQASRAAAAAMLLDTVDWRVGLQRSRAVYRVGGASVSPRPPDIRE